MRILGVHLILIIALITLLLASIDCHSIAHFNYGPESSRKAATDKAQGPLNCTIDSIAVHKAKRELLVFNHKRLIKTYTVQLGTCPIGAKECKGDCKTPEGLYYINSKNANSEFHKSLGVSYPNRADIQHANRMGKSPGGDVLVHGLPNGAEKLGPKRYRNDWTLGCIALRNEEVDELYPRVKIGTPIFISP